MGKELFGITSKGKEAYKYVIENQNGMKAVLSDFGATLLELYVKDKDGALTDVVLGYDDIASYERELTFFGATVGPYANRIANASFEIDGVVYTLDKNNYENNLHSGQYTMAKDMWEVKEHSKNQIVFTFKAAHIERGFPGNVEVDVTYTLTPEDALEISYYGLSDKKTTFNMTNHSYFNLDGSNAGDVLEHVLWLKASAYTPAIDEKSIPTGEIATVEGTPFDFREPKTIGRDIRADHAQIRYGTGYDHNIALDKETDGVEKVASVYAPATGIVMDVWTDCIGMQIYTGNFMDGQIGKNGYRHPQYGAVCLETQFFPDSINNPNFVRPITEANVPYVSKTIYGFTTK